MQQNAMQIDYNPSMWVLLIPREVQVSLWHPGFAVELEHGNLLDATPEAENLVQTLVDLDAIPRQAAEDAAHIAIAVTNGVEFPAYCQCNDAFPNRADMPAGRL